MAVTLGNCDRKPNGLELSTKLSANGNTREEARTAGIFPPLRETLDIGTDVQPVHMHCADL